MPSDVVRVNSYKWDGSLSRSWTGRLVEQSGPLVVLLGIFDGEIEHPEIGLIRAGTLSYEYYWLDRWYNVFRFHEPDGSFRGFYCNLSTPAKFDSGTIDFTDLDIDILIDSGFEWKLLDEDDFARNSAALGYGTDVETRVELAKKKLIENISRREFPFDYTVEG